MDELPYMVLRQSLTQTKCFAVVSDSSDEKALLRNRLVVAAGHHDLISDSPVAADCSVPVINEHILTQHNDVAAYGSIDSQNSLNNSFLPSNV